jgi:hypothetical protein
MQPSGLKMYRQFERMSEGTPASLKRLLLRFEMSFTAVVTFCWHLSSFSYRFRKALFTSARVQLYPTAHTRLYDAFYSELSEIVFVPGDPDLGRPDHTYTSGFETLSLVSSWLPSPVLSGFLSLLIREWPILDTSEVASIIESSIIKEFSAAQQIVKMLH